MIKRLVPVLTAAVSVSAAAALVAAPVAAQEPLTTIAEHAVIIDYDTGEALLDKAGDTPMYPASMTKIMTVEMVFERLADGSLSLDDTFTVSEHAWREGGAASGGSTMFLKPGEEVTVDALLHGIIVQSGNDASIVVAEALDGSEAAFADEMTSRAHELGLNSLNFTNAPGLPDPDHVVSAMDLAMLARHQIMTYPDLYAIYAVEEYTHNGIRQYNRNPLLGRIEGVDGLKTGHTEASGYGVVLSGVRDGERRIVVINGLDSETERAQESERLMRAAFTEFKRYRLFEEGDEAGSINVFMGRSGQVAVRAAEDVDITLHRNSRPDMQVYIDYSTPRAPIAEGDQVATLIVEAPGYAPKTYPLVAAHEVAKKGVFGRAGDALIHMIRSSGDSDAAGGEAADSADG